MSLFVRQVWTLIEKNLLLAAVRRPLSTILRAAILPLVIVLVISYSQNFFNPNQRFGIGQPTPVLPLADALAAGSAGRNTVVFVDNGFIGGAITAVIEDVSEFFHRAGLQVVTVHTQPEVDDACQSSQKGSSNCFAAAMFISSATEPNARSNWNYTLRADESLGSSININSPHNDAQIYLLPLQHAIDTAILEHTPEAKAGALSRVEQYPYTTVSEAKHQHDNRLSYLDRCIAFFTILFFLALVPVVYQLTGLMASERELGLSQLLEAMMPNTMRWQPQAARLLSYHGAFSIMYGPSWLAVGAVLSTVVFKYTSAATIIFYHLTLGLALCSFSILGASFFKNSQVCSITATVVTLVMAIIPQVLPPNRQTSITVQAMCLVFPSSNYVYFLINALRFELKDRPAVLAEVPPGSQWLLDSRTMWCFLIFQILLYPLLAALVEIVLFSPRSGSRRMIQGHSKGKPTVRIQSFSKTYRQHWLFRVFTKNPQPVQAVADLTLEARQGQILMLLGPNGSGKSTTLDAVAGLSKLSNGSIEVDGTNGLGIAPQKNILWDDLTVREHVRILYHLKVKRNRSAKTEITSMINGCDLVTKINAKAKSLSGGQKRKLQLAMMFSGGSHVCCVDEVSSGLDPLSRRKIWDILLAERGDRTIIMTTHFLDEADFLSDHIVILSKGRLQAQGTSAGLKHSFGDGYTVTAPLEHGLSMPPQISGAIGRLISGIATYAHLSPAVVSRVTSHLEGNGIDDFNVSGPTLEEIFLKLTGTSLHDSTPKVSLKAMKEKRGIDEDSPMDDGMVLRPGKPISALKQTLVLLAKRCTVLRSSYMPYVCALIVSLIGAGVSPLFLKPLGPMECALPNNTIAEGYYSYTGYAESLAQLSEPSFLGGPPSLISETNLASLADVYSTNHTRYGYTGFPNASALRATISPARTLADFTEGVAHNNVTLDPGAFWLGDSSSPPQFAWVHTSYDISSGVLTQNVINNLLGGVKISTAYASFDIPPEPQRYNFFALIFTIYFTLTFCVYPGFFAIYPTIERLRNVRSLQYSNGVRPVPLWIAHLFFDTIFIVLVSIFSMVLLITSSHLWYHIPYLFLILVLYGISSAMLGYIVSMLARSHLSALAMVVGGQVLMSLVYFGAYLGVQSNTDVADLESTLNKVHFSVALFSPSANVLRALFVSLNQFLILCGHESNPEDIQLYGGPILYLILQPVVLFGTLLWMDSGFSLFELLRRNKTGQSNLDTTATVSPEIAKEIDRVATAPSGLGVSHLSKKFGKNQAVDDVTFSVEKGEIFALLGPNGAGKSTALSLIRGDFPPSSREAEILVDESSIFTHRALALSHLGVCPQFDACDTLTVTQYLKFYAQVRGVSDPSHNVAELIRAFGLTPYRHRLAQKLSGGNKRKLSLAIALVGNPSVVLLDEPSSGLDAAFKRVLWKKLSAVSKDRAIVLTTHSMEEADALAHRAGIVSSRMLTIGTVDHLRKRWGDVYHVHIVTASAPYTSLGEIERLKSWIRGSFPDAEIDEKAYCGQIRFSVPMMKNARGSGAGLLFRMLFGNKEELGIEYYAIRQTTMDEVFVKIVREHRGKEE